MEQGRTQSTSISAIHATLPMLTRPLQRRMLFTRPAPTAARDEARSCVKIDQINLSRLLPFTVLPDRVSLVLAPSRSASASGFALIRLAALCTANTPVPNQSALLRRLSELKGQGDEIS